MPWCGSCLIRVARCRGLIVPWPWPISCGLYMSCVVPWLFLIVHVCCVPCPLPHYSLYVMPWPLNACCEKCCACPASLITVPHALPNALAHILYPYLVGIMCPAPVRKNRPGWARWFEQKPAFLPRPTHSLALMCKPSGARALELC